MTPSHWTMYGKSSIISISMSISITSWTAVRLSNESQIDSDWAMVPCIEYKVNTSLHSSFRILMTANDTRPIGVEESTMTTDNSWVLRAMMKRRIFAKRAILTRRVMRMIRNVRRPTMSTTSKIWRCCWMISPTYPYKDRNSFRNCWWRVRGIFQVYAGEIF